MGVTAAESIGLIEPVCQTMVRRGWRVKVVCDIGSKPDVLQAHPDLDVHLLPMSRAITPILDLRALALWVKLLRQERPHAVVGATPKGALLSMIAARIVGTPIRIFHVWGARWDGLRGSKSNLLRAMDRLAAGCSTDVVLVSHSLAELFQKNNITGKPGRVIGRGGSKGVDTHRFTPIDRPAGRSPTLGFVGRLSKDKGIADVLTVFESCRELIPECQLKVLGRLDSAQPIDMVTQARLRQPGVQWLGPVTDVTSHMQHFDVLVFPSVREGLPNAVIEAAACGVPTVGYDTTGVRDAVENGVTGILVPLGDVTALTHATVRALNPVVRQSMSRQARRFAADNFDQTVVIRGFVDFIQEQLPHTRTPKGEAGLPSRGF